MGRDSALLQDKIYLEGFSFILTMCLTAAMPPACARLLHLNRGNLPFSWLLFLQAFHIFFLAIF